MSEQKSFSAQLGSKKRRLNEKVEGRKDFEWRPSQNRQKKEDQKAMSKFVLQSLDNNNTLQLNINKILVPINMK